MTNAPHWVQCTIPIFAHTYILTSLQNSIAPDGCCLLTWSSIHSQLSLTTCPSLPPSCRQFPGVETHHHWGCPRERSLHHTLRCSGATEPQISLISHDQWNPYHQSVCGGVGVVVGWYDIDGQKEERTGEVLGVAAEHTCTCTHVQHIHTYI